MITSTLFALLAPGCGEYIKPDYLYSSSPEVVPMQTETSTVSYYEPATEDYPLSFAMIDVKPGQNLNLGFLTQYATLQNSSGENVWDDRGPVHYTMCAAQAPAEDVGIDSIDLPVTGNSCPFSESTDPQDGRLNWQTLDTSSDEFNFQYGERFENYEFSSISMNSSWPSKAGAYFALLADQNVDSLDLQGGAQFYVGNAGW